MNTEDVQNAESIISYMKLIPREHFKLLFIKDIIPEVKERLKIETIDYYISDSNFIKILSYAGFTVNQFIEMVKE